MTNGEEAPDEEVEDAEATPPATVDDSLDAVTTALAAETTDKDALEEALAGAEAAVDAAETEADLDSIEGALDDIETAVADADLPTPEDEDDEDLREQLESRLSDVRDALEEARGPYAADAIESIQESKSTIADTRWTEQGEGETVDAVGAFVTAINETLDTSVAVPETPDGLDEALTTTVDRIEAAELYPDEDADTIAALIEATDTLAGAVDAAQAWDDLTVREQLQAEGFFDVLDHHKDFPPEWSALKVWERRGNAEMILLALEKFDSDFMEEHCLDALRRMGPEEAIEPMLKRAGRRDQPAIEILGKIASDESIDTLVEYTGEDSDDSLRRTTLKALGEIGSEEVTQAVANCLVADAESVRSQAARALGMIGDTRAIDPLADVLENDTSDTVRGSAAWALNQIGTERALEIAAGYGDDRVYLVQAEAEKAADGLAAATA